MPDAASVAPKFSRWAAVALAVVAGASTQAGAAPLLFDNRAAFEAAVGQTSLITFDQFAIGAVPSCLPVTPYIPDPCVFQTGGVTFATTVALQNFNQRPLLVIDNGIGAPPPPVRQLVSTQTPRAEDEFFFTFAGDVIGFSIISGNPGTYRVVVTDDADLRTTSDISVGPVVPIFYGASAPDGLARVSVFALGTTSANFAIDNVAVRSVPEPASAVLLGVGMFGYWRRRRADGARRSRPRTNVTLERRPR